MIHGTLVPAYGRDYKSAKALLEDFNNNKDFRIEPAGRYINKEDIVREGIKSINARYSNLRKVTVIKL